MQQTSSAAWDAFERYVLELLKSTFPKHTWYHQGCHKQSERGLDMIGTSLLLHKADLETAKSVLELVDYDYSRITDYFKLAEDAKASPDELLHVRQTIEQLVERIGKAQILQQLQGIDEDILGAYFYRVPEVHLYWAVIGLVAGTIGVSVEALTFVVAAHELAHAYSHLGKDIDGERWHTEAFARAELPIAEGLAQFYTCVICDKVSHRFPEAKIAYEKLLELQPTPYQVQKDWVAEDNRKGEFVRFAMIECRRRRISEYVDFEANLREIETRSEGTKAG